MLYVTVVTWVVAIGWAWWDPRRVSAGVGMWIALGLTVTEASAGLLARLGREGENTLAIWLLAGAGVFVFASVVLAVALIGNGIVMWRREGRRLPNLLAGLAGLALLGYIGLYAVALITESLRLLIVLLALVLPIGLAGFGFLAYVSWAGLYLGLTRHITSGVSAVIVLGSGLIRGRVPPLLASRLDKGRQTYQKVRATGADPVMIVSGGQGADEPRSEAAAMAEYLTDAGLSADAILTEDQSRTTAENLVLSAKLLPVVPAASRGWRRVLRPRWATRPATLVVTNTFHAFRAATLMRRVGLPGHAVGAPTAGYYWPSATIREYVALLRDSRALSISVFAIACVPTLATLVGLLVGAFGV